MIINHKIFFIGRKNDFFSIRFCNILKKNFKQLKSFYNDGRNHNQLKKKIRIWKGDYIICFRSNYLFDKREVNKFDGSIINFHPGPPEYRGIGCVNFAKFNNAKRYGATVHIIDSKEIDNGKILHVLKWDVKKNETIDEILSKTYLTQLKQLRIIIKFIKKNNLKYLSNKFKNYKWARKLYTRRDLEELYKINPKISANKFFRILRATVTKKYKPYIILNKTKFLYEQH
jgi:methionyl-tRNA formyltransferase